MSYETPDIPEDAPTVLFLGDSITAGLHLPPDQAFPAAVQRQALDYGVPFHIVNAGVSGDTTRGGLNRLDFLLKNTSPDVVVVELGANDALRGQSLTNIETNLKEIIATIHLTDAQVLLLGMNAPTNLGDYAREFGEMYTRISGELDVQLVPSFLDGVGGLPEMNLPDGLHPTPEGHERLAKNIVRPLTSMISTASPLLAPGQRPQGR
ncbi:arylesterase [Saltatorellus ferox]|uniref:arylesterase n=1 Tax=Saltatorellus ferox TaxID=2528018 RepID=UPI003AF3E78B